MSTPVEDLLRKVPPQDLDAEGSVLGAIFLENAVLDDVLELVQVDDFYRESHRQIFQAMIDLAERNEPIDAITLTDALRGRGVLEQIGGPAYLAELADLVPTAANAAYYAKIVRDKALLRRIIQVATAIAAEGYEQADAEAFADSAARRICEVCEPRGRAGQVHISEILPTVVKNIEQRVADGNLITGIATGLDDLDVATSGLQPSELVIIAARPSMGKSALMGNIAMHAALREHKHVLVFSVEMSRELLVEREACAESEIDLSAVRRGMLNSDKLRKLGAKAAEISKGADLWIDDSSDITPLLMRARCRRQKRTTGLDLVLVDYLQLVKSTVNAGDGRRPSWRNREQEVADISKSLKALAKELRIPVVALAQLNRQVETRTDRRPILADIRESGSIEQDADVIAFLYRDEVYHKDSEDKGIAEINVAKQRNGVVDIARVAWLPQYSKFVNLSTKEEA